MTAVAKPDEVQKDSAAALSVQSRQQTAVLCGVAAMAVFLFDLITPVGVAESVLHVLVVLIALRAPFSRLVIGVAAFSTVLTVVGFFLSPAGANLWIGIANRSFALLAIWTTGLIGLHRRTLFLERERLRTKHEALLLQALEAFIPICAWCKKVREGESWRPLESYVTIRTGSRFSHGICPDCAQQADT